MGVAGGRIQCGAVAQSARGDHRAGHLPGRLWGQRIHVQGGALSPKT